jgi:hypothetical protein
MAVGATGNILQTIASALAPPQAAKPFATRVTETAQRAAESGSVATRDAALAAIDKAARRAAIEPPDPSRPRPRGALLDISI